MSAEQYSAQFVKGSHWALVIGISKYKHGIEKGQDLGDKGFPNLKVADKDAKDFADFLRIHNGYLSNAVIELKNETADATSIKKAFSELRKNCKDPASPNPLVIVYFAGHGWCDDEGQRYLVPYDGERDDLRATALSNKDFSDLLGELKTDRLVVFLDACRSGGVSIEGSRGGDQYSYEGVIGAGKGRYLIASCMPGQLSYELEGENGIFTKHLLELLKGETDDIADPKITPSNLEEPLRMRVQKTAHDRFNGAKQEVAASVSGGGGIVLAINRKLVEKKAREDAAADDRRREFLKRVCDAIDDGGKREDMVDIVQSLRRYVRTGDKEPGQDTFYVLFEKRLKTWRGDSAAVASCAGLLVFTYGESPAPVETSPVEQAKSIDAFVKASAGSSLATDAPVVAPRPPAGQQDAERQRRQLSQEDRKYILGDIELKASYRPDARVLRMLLERAVSEEEFMDAVNQIQDRRPDAQSTALLDNVVSRFGERWPEGQAVQSHSVAGFLTRKTRDD